MALVRDDFPALGKPTRPTSAMDLRTRRYSPCSPVWPGFARLGALLVDVLKCVLPQPPLPPLQSTILWPPSTTSATTRPVARSVTTVPRGSLRTASRPSLPLQSLPMPCSPRPPFQWGLNL